MNYFLWSCLETVCFSIWKVQQRSCKWETNFCPTPDWNATLVPLPIISQISRTKYSVLSDLCSTSSILILYRRIWIYPTRKKSAAKGIFQKSERSTLHISDHYTAKQIVAREIQKSVGAHPISSVVVRNRRPPIWHFCHQLGKQSSQKRLQYLRMAEVYTFNLEETSVMLCMSESLKCQVSCLLR